MKRFFDIFFSSLAILILSPLLIPIIIILKLTGEHYIFYAQKRMGKNETPFNVLKFATIITLNNYFRIILFTACSIIKSDTNFRPYFKDLPEPKEILKVLL